MADSTPYRKQVALILRVLPIVAQENCFALKGGTAINLFIRNMPRLSVDIDLAYLLVQPRDESLQQIDTSLKKIASRIEETVHEQSVQCLCRIYLSYSLYYLRYFFQGTNDQLLMDQM